MLAGLQETLTDAMVDDWDEPPVGAKDPPLHPVIHNMPEKKRQSAAMRCIKHPPLFIPEKLLAFSLSN